MNLIAKLRIMKEQGILTDEEYNEAVGNVNVPEEVVEESAKTPEEPTQEVEQPSEEEPKTEEVTETVEEETPPEEPTEVQETTDVVQDEEPAISEEAVPQPTPVEEILNNQPTETEILQNRIKSLEELNTGLSSRLDSLDELLAKIQIPTDTDSNEDFGISGKGKISETAPEEDVASQLIKKMGGYAK